MITSDQQWRYTHAATLKSLGHKPSDWSESNVATTITHTTKCLICKTQFGIQRVGELTKIIHLQMADVYQNGYPRTQRPMITTVWHSYEDRPNPFFICERLKVFV